jgi:hypothetical protein
MKRRTIAALTVPVAAALTGCTPAQIDAWLAWHAHDPAAAVEFAHRPDVQADMATGEHLAIEDNVADIPAVGWTLDWDAVAWCESGAKWSHGPVRNSAGTFSGGLMIGHEYWDGYGGYSAPYHAPKDVQIAWAEDLIDGSYAAADRAWQCVGGPARGGA